jgi:hypothetical protein
MPDPIPDTSFFEIIIQSGIRQTKSRRSEPDGTAFSVMLKSISLDIKSYLIWQKCAENVSNRPAY